MRKHPSRYFHGIHLSTYNFHAIALSTIHFHIVPLTSVCASHAVAYYLNNILPF